MRPYQTMRATFEHICQGVDPWLPLGNFMNDWYDNYVEERAQLLHDPLPDDYPPQFHRWAVFCAGSVEWFSHTYNVPCPGWVHDPRYSLKDAWIFHDSQREELLQTTPGEFAGRNVFCGERIYANKWELVEEIRLRYAPLLAERKAQVTARRALAEKRRTGWRGVIARRIPAVEQFLIGSRW